MSELELRHAHDWDEVWRAAVGAGRTFPGRTPEAEFFFAYTLRAPGLPLDNVFLAVKDGAIVSQVLVHERGARITGLRARMGAIGAVYTLPEHQGNGYADRLLEHVRAALEEREYAYSMLHTGSGIQSLYAGRGWEELLYPRYSLAAPPTGEGQTGRLRPFEPGADLEAVAATYRATYGETEGAMCRPGGYWRDWILDPEKEVLGESAELSVYEEGDTVTGYLAADGPECLEVAYRGDNDERFLLACWDRLAGAGPVTWHPPLPEGLLAAADLDVTEEQSEGTMLQLHDPAVVSRLAGEAVESTAALADRLRADRFLPSPLDSF